MDASERKLLIERVSMVAAIALLIALVAFAREAMPAVLLMIGTIVGHFTSATLARSVEQRTEKRVRGESVRPPSDSG